MAKRTLTKKVAFEDTLKGVKEKAMRISREVYYRWREKQC